MNITSSTFHCKVLTLLLARWAAPLADAPLTHDVAMETLRISLAHRDPADVFLAATARVYGLTLVTADERLLRTKDLAVLANR